MTRHPKLSDSEFDKKLSAIKTDYVTVIREQKNRILKLREDNSELSKKVSEYEHYSKEMANALMDARFKAEEIINDAKIQAEEIIKRANEQQLKSDKTIKYYNNSLKELELRSERILNFIKNELSKESRATLSIVNQ